MYNNVKCYISERRTWVLSTSFKCSDQEITEVKESKTEKNLGLLVSSSLSWKDQMHSVISKANKMIGMLKNTFINRDIKLSKQLYTSMIRLHLEYAIQFWNPYQIGDIDIIERIQRATKISKSLWTKSYSERLVILGLTKLEERRTRGDLIQIAKGVDIVEWEEEIELRNIRRGNDLSFNRKAFKLRNSNDYAYYASIRHNFFTNMVTQIWNKLPRSVVNSPSLNSFKKG